MKATISSNKQAITLENGTVFNIEANETVADFMSRVRKVVKEEYLEDLKIEKAMGNPEIDALKKELIDQSDANRKAKAEKTKVEKPQLSEEEKAAIKEAAAKAKEEAAKAKEEAKAKMAEEKAKAKEEAAKAKAEAKAKADEEREAAAKEALEARKEELRAKAEEMIAEAKNKAEEMIKNAQLKADEHVIKVTEAALKMVETGAAPRAINASNPSGIRVSPEEDQIAYIDSIVGSRVSFEKGGNTITGKITARSIDYRVGIVFARITSDEGLTYHKSFNKINELTILDSEPVTETAE